MKQMLSRMEQEEIENTSTQGMAHLVAQIKLSLILN
jgi:hypothetical protein